MQKNKLIRSEVSGIMQKNKLIRSICLGEWYYAEE